MVESSTCAVCKEMHGDSRRERSEDGGNDGDDDIPCDLRAEALLLDRSGKVNVVWSGMKIVLLMTALLSDAALFESTSIPKSSREPY